MSEHPVKQYIAAARGQGMDNEQIVQALTQVGWQMHDIVDIVAEPIVQGTDESIIQIRNVSKSYGSVTALKDVSLDVMRGSVTALLGPNGAGKTTLIRIMTTLLLPTSGSVTVAGFDVIRDAQKLRGIIGLSGQYAAIDEILTGRENLEMFARLYHLSVSESKARARELLHDFDLDDAADRTLKTYSGGMRRRLDLAASLIIKPKILFLDEPTTGLDPRSRFSMWNVIRDLVRDGTTVLLTTQYLEEADQLANQIFVIDHGHIIAQGSADELKRQVGGDVLELHLTDHHDATRAADAIKRFGKETPHPNDDTGIVTMPLDRGLPAGRQGAAVLVDIVRELDGAGIKLSDVMLRRPSLDDVFMKLTGHSAE